jgi:hypothetical protein
MRGDHRDDHRARRRDSNVLKKKQKLVVIGSLGVCAVLPRDSNTLNYYSLGNRTEQSSELSFSEAPIGEVTEVTSEVTEVTREVTEVTSHL